MALGLASGYGAQAGALALKEILEERVKAQQQEFENQRRQEEFQRQQTLRERTQGQSEREWNELAPTRDAGVGLTTAQTGLTSANTARVAGEESREAAKYGRLSGLEAIADRALEEAPTPAGRLPLRAIAAINETSGLNLTTPGGDVAAYGPGATALQAWKGGGREIAADEANINANAQMRVVGARQAASGGGQGGPGQWDQTAEMVIDNPELLKEMSPAQRGQVIQAIARTGGNLENKKRQSLTNILNETIQAIQDVRNHPGFSGAIGAPSITQPGSWSRVAGMPSAPGSAPAGAEESLKTLTGRLVLPRLDVMRGLGPMSEREFAVMGQSASKLSQRLGEGETLAELDRLEQAARAALERAQGGGDESPAIPNGMPAPMRSSGGGWRRVQ